MEDTIHPMIATLTTGTQAAALTAHVHAVRVAAQEISCQE